MSRPIVHDRTAAAVTLGLIAGLAIAGAATWLMLRASRPAVVTSTVDAQGVPLGWLALIIGGLCAGSWWGHFHAAWIGGRNFRRSQRRIHKHGVPR